MTEDHLKLVRFLNVEDESDDVLTINKHVMLTLQTHILDDVDLLDTYHYVSDNLFYIETLLHQRCTQGIVPGHYKCNDAVMLWEYVTD